MSEITINYKARTEPSSLRVRFGLGFAGTSLQASVRDYSDFVAVLEPTGNISEAILSGVAWPLAQTAGLLLPQLGRQLITGYRFDVMTIMPSTHAVAGEQVTVSPSNLSLSEFGDMLLIEARLVIA